MKKHDLPKTIPVFPLINFIIFPHTTVQLNVFEPRYIEMINDSMKTNKMIGLIQPKSNDDSSIPGLHKIGCLGKIINFKDTSDGRYMIELNGITRFTITKEIKSTKPYRICETNYDNFELDLTSEKKKLKFSDLESIFKDLKLLLEKTKFKFNGIYIYCAAIHGVATLNILQKNQYKVISLIDDNLEIEQQTLVNVDIIKGN